MDFRRSDIESIDSIEDAFDFSTAVPQLIEVARIRAAVAYDLVYLTEHAIWAAKDDTIPQTAIYSVIQNGNAASKDLDPGSPRAIGINFEGKVPGGKRISVKVGWDGGFFVATVYKIVRFTSP